jgi:hypothetical protein
MANPSEESADYTDYPDHREMSDRLLFLKSALALVCGICVICGLGQNLNLAGCDLIGVRVA